jgi:hypothetical protein
MSKAVDVEVRSALFTAASKIMIGGGQPSSLRSLSARMAQRKGCKPAMDTVARKIAVLLHAMWTDVTLFCNVEKEMLAWRCNRVPAKTALSISSPGADEGAAQSRTCRLRTLARLKASHTDPIRPMPVAAPSWADTPTTQISVTRKGRHHAIANWSFTSMPD